MNSRLRSSLLFTSVLALFIASASALSVNKRSVGDEANFDTVEACQVTDLPIRGAEYEAVCGDKSDPKHPCFTHLGAGTLASVHIAPFLEPIENIKDGILIKDDNNYTDFAFQNASDAYKITYVGSGQVQFVYSNYDPKTGCYDVALRRGGAGRQWRIWFSDDVGSDRDIDIENYEFTSGRFCTKWGHIHVGYSDDLQWAL